MNGTIIDASIVLGISIERLFQKAAEAHGFTNYLEVGTYRYQAALHREENPPNYVLDFCNPLFSKHETCADEGGLIHSGAD